MAQIVSFIKRYHYQSSDHRGVPCISGDSSTAVITLMISCAVHEYVHVIPMLKRFGHFL